MVRGWSSLLALFAVLGALVAACGGGGGGGATGGQDDTPATKDPVANVPSENGVRDSVQAAATPAESDFPASKGKTLQELANGMTSGPSLAMASSVFTTPGDSRMAFGMVDANGSPVYGPTAIYVAPTPNDPAE